jgi:hypothetical protein
MARLVGRVDLRLLGENTMLELPAMKTPAGPRHHHFIAVTSPQTIGAALSSQVWGRNKKAGLPNVSLGAHVALYVSQLHLFAATAEVVSGYYYDQTSIWRQATYPHRLKLALRFASTDPSNWVDVVPLISSLTFITKPEHYGVFFRANWFGISPGDFSVIEAALRDQLSR